MCVHNGMEQWSDMEYVEKVQAGDAEYFAPLLERYSQPVFSLLVRIVGNREDAEELTQDVFLKVFRSLSLQSEKRKVQKRKTKSPKNSTLFFLSAEFFFTLRRSARSLLAACN